jgi:hypothetical protein
MISPMMELWVRSWVCIKFEVVNRTASTDEGIWMSIAYNIGGIY